MHADYSNIATAQGGLRLKENGLVKQLVGRWWWWHVSYCSPRPTSHTTLRKAFIHNHSNYICCHSRTRAIFIWFKH